MDRTSPAFHIARNHMRAGRPGHAFPIFARLLASAPTDPKLLQDAGEAALGIGKFDDASEFFSRALELAPSSRELRQGLIQALYNSGETQKCRDLVQSLAAEDPDNVQFVEQMGHLEAAMGRYRDALRWESKLTEITPDNPSLALRRARHSLATGDLAAGWERYDARLRFWSPPPVAAPRWDGSDLAGKDIVVQFEQADVENLVFMRCIPALTARGARVTLSAPQTLEPLLRVLPDIEAIVSPNDAPAADLRIEMGSLPALLGVDRPASVPAPPYLEADALLKAGWKSRFTPDGRLTVGLAWNCDRPTDSGSMNGSCPWDTFKDLLDVPNIRFVALDPVTPIPGIEDVSCDLTDIGDRAALIASLDLVIAVEGISAHVAGALGTPLWMVLPLDPEWWWMEAGTSSPWYPMVRQFRADGPGDWKPTIAAVSAALREYGTGNSR